MFIYTLNMQFLIKNLISCLLITRQFICAPNLPSVKRDAARTRKKIRGFMIHAAYSIRIAIDAGNSDASLRNCLHRIP
jgi:hypothetical protein